MSIISKPWKLYNAAKAVFKSQKTTGTGAINQVNISKNLKKLRKIKDEGFEAVDKQTKGTNVSNQKKSEIKKSFSGKVSNIIENKATGGRVGRRFGSPKPKTNVQKIKETFGPKKKLSEKQMKIVKLAGDPKRIDAPDFKKLRGKA